MVQFALIMFVVLVAVLLATSTAVTSLVLTYATPYLLFGSLPITAAAVLAGAIVLARLVLFVLPPSRVQLVLFRSLTLLVFVAAGVLVLSIFV